MKTLFLLLAFLVSNVADASPRSVAIGDTLIGIKVGAVALNKRTESGRLYSPPTDKVDLVAFVVGILGFISLLPLSFLPFLCV